MYHSIRQEAEQDIYIIYEKYFRPSKFPAIKLANLDNFIHENYKEDPTQITIPLSLNNTAENTLFNFFSILQEANQGTTADIGCGSIGYVEKPYGVAYAFLSKELKKHLTYQQFLEIFKNIYHINLLAMVRMADSSSSSNTKTFLIEMETIEGTSFRYYYSFIEVVRENHYYKINSLQFNNEDFLCNFYHGWQHNAEAQVAVMYGDWCKLIKKQYPIQQEGAIKKVLIDGTDGSQYMFIFLGLTNGTDILIGQYRKTQFGQWNEIHIDPHKCLE